jgi:pantoate--beta-alanine ligase
MIIIRDPVLLKKELVKIRNQKLLTGFVPTMGALHDGHISLIKQCKESCGFTICSIFVNPTQFNNKEDLQKYPKTLEQDIDLLESEGCDLLFLPEIIDIYPDDYEAEYFELGELDKKWEGKFRPGHFQGVCQVVSILMSLIAPDQLFLGEKDYQQCLVLCRLAELQKWKTKIVICPTLREKDGLAMSSRNRRISISDRTGAAAIFNALCCLRQQLSEGNVETTRKECEKIMTNEGFKIEYFAIIDDQLNEVTSWNGATPLRGIVAASLGGVRLIDNMRVTD